MQTATQKQTSFIVSLANKAYGKDYRFVTQIEEKSIGKMAKKIGGMKSLDASRIISELIDEVKNK